MADNDKYLQELTEIDSITLASLLHIKKGAEDFKVLVEDFLDFIQANTTPSDIDALGMSSAEYADLNSRRDIICSNVEIPDGDSLILQELTVPTGKTLTVLRMGISIVGNGTPDEDVIIEIGSYSGTFSQLNSSYARTVELSTSNTFAQNIVVQFRLKNSSGASARVTAFLAFKIT